MGYDLLYHRLHLVHLDGVNHIVLALVVILLRCLLEATPSLLYAVVENIGEAQQDGGRNVAQLQFVHHLAQVYLNRVLAWCHIDVAGIVDAEVTGAPAVDVVQLAGVINSPFLHSSNSWRSFSIVIFILSKLSISDTSRV